MKTRVPHLVVNVIAMLIAIAGCSSDQSRHTGHDSLSAQSKEIYTCPMHPSVISDRPGACPVCGMALVRKSETQNLSASTLADVGQIAVSPTQRVLANITTEPVLRRSLQKTIPLVGVVEYAEPFQATVAARFRGRVEKLFVAFTGQEVQRGEPLFDLYSPDVASAQQEFLSSLDAYQRAVANGEESNRTMQQRLLQAARDRLKIHFGMTETQIAELERTREHSSTVRFHSPIRGTVVAKQVQEGQYVDEGMVLYQLVNLSRVWVYIDVYEKDLRFVRVGQPVQIMIEAYPDRNFSGTVTFVDPVISGETRTARVRAEFDNPGGVLKPKMFVQAEISVPLRNALVVPTSSVLLTGRRAVVWVEVRPNVFEPRSVTLGASSDSYYEVLSGVHEGERVATSGGFLLDSESQLQASSTDLHAGHTAQRSSAHVLDSSNRESIRILVKGSYIPDVVRVKKGKKVVLQFYRDEDADCTNEVVFADFKIRKQLPARQITSIELTPNTTGEFRFTCGMGMVHGTLIVE